MLSECFLKLTPSVLGRLFFTYILLIISRFYTPSEIHVGIKIVQTLAISLLTSIDPSQNKKNRLITPKLKVKMCLTTRTLLE